MVLQQTKWWLVDFSVSYIKLSRFLVCHLFHLEIIRVCLLSTVFVSLALIGLVVVGLSLSSIIFRIVLTSSPNIARCVLIHLLFGWANSVTIDVSAFFHTQLYLSTNLDHILFSNVSWH